MKLNEMFEQAPLKKVYFQLALPVIASMVAALIYNLADGFFVAQMNDTDLLAAVTLCSPLFSLLVALGDVFGIGASAAISRRLGEKNYEASLRLSCFSFYFAAAFSVVVSVIMLLNKHFLLTLLGATSATWADADAFFTPLVLGAVAIIWSIVPANIIRTEGLATKAMVATLTGVGVSLVLDPIFLFGLKWGAAGVAIANVIGFFAEDLLLIYYIWRYCRYQTFNLRYLKITGREFWEIIAIGVPSALSNVMLMLATATLNNYLAHYSTSAVATNGIVSRIYQIVVMVQVGAAFGAQPLLGYNFGAKNWDRLKAAIKFDIWFEVIYAVVVAAGLIICAHPLIAVFMDKPIVQHLGFEMLVAMLISSPAVGVMYVAITFFQSSRQSLLTFVLTVLRQGVLYLPMIYVLDRIGGYVGIISAQPLSDILSAIIAVALLVYFFRRHTQAKTEA